ncbi:MAG: tetratricopeptide repeat protein [Ignavibacteria bacterium]|nr:tetratricopeptide repeat protein [Ignavibacteria bacterium]
MKKLIIYVLFLLLFGIFSVFNGCTKKSETELRREKDSLEQVKYDEVIRELIDSNVIKMRDSTDVYGTGNFDYKDSLESYHRGYSIPRDSIYKVWNTKAFQELNELIRKKPTQPGPYLDRGNHFQNIKMYRDAISDYNAYIKLNQSNPSAYMNRGNAYERFKIYDSAMADYNMVLYLKPDDTIANFNKGNIYDILGKPDSAVLQYDTVIFKDPRLAKAYYNRGTSYLAQRKFKEAARDWEQAIALNRTYEMELRPKINKIRPLIK